jgi:hypothetical protein
MRDNQQYRQHYDLLRLFAYGTYQDYASEQTLYKKKLRLKQS